MTATGATSADVWAALVRDENPAPPHEAIDFLMESLRCERRRAVRLLFIEAAGWLKRREPNNYWRHTAGELLDELRVGKILPDADAVVDVFRNTDPGTWTNWCDDADRALALLRTIQEIPQ